MKARFALVYMCAFTMIIALGCEKELLLSPNDIVSNDYSALYPATNLMDSFINTSWIGNTFEYVDYNFSTPIIVTKVLVQNYGEELYSLSVDVDLGSRGWIGYERNVPAYSVHSWKANNLHVKSLVRLWVITNSSSIRPIISRFYVFGCHPTSFTYPTTSGCDKEILLLPWTIASNDYTTSYPITNWIDTDPDTLCKGKIFSEYVDYNFSAPIYVTEVLVQNYGEELLVLSVLSRTRVIGYEENVEAYSTHSWKANNLYVSPESYVRLKVVTSSSIRPHISRFDVFGCYDTTTPTIFPTNVGPPSFTSMHPTTSSCEKEIMLSPETIYSNDFSTAYPSTNLIDTDLHTRWKGKDFSEYVDYNFSTPIIVAEVLVQNYGEELSELSVFIVRANGIGYLGCERNVEAISAHSWKANNFYVSPPEFVRLHVRTTSSINPVLTRFYVFGCNECTDSPTIRPTRDPINALVIMITIFLFVPISICGTIPVRRKWNWRNQSNNLLDNMGSVLNNTWNLPSELWELKQYFMKNIELRRQIASGSFSMVHIMKLKESDSRNDMIVAGKILYQMNDADFLQEVTLNLKASETCNNIVRVIGFVMQPKVILMEYHWNGSLAVALKNDYN